MLKYLCCVFITDIHDFILERNNATNNTDYLANDFLKATLQFSGKMHTMNLVVLDKQDIWITIGFIIMDF